MLHNDSVDNFICNSYNYIEHIPFFTIVRDLQYCKFYIAQKTNNQTNAVSSYSVYVYQSRRPNTTNTKYLRRPKCSEHQKLSKRTLKTIGTKNPTTILNTIHTKTVTFTSFDCNIQGYNNTYAAPRGKYIMTSSN